MNRDTEPDPTLLDAVDALTKPVQQVRWQDAEHDHEWLQLVRQTTREERDAAKAKKVKLGKTIPTGEWWCLWCDLTVDEKPEAEAEQTISRQDEPPLLDQLQDRIGTTLGDGGTRGARTGGSPIDLAAFMLHRRIDDAIRTWMTELGARPGKDIRTAQLLRSWYTLRLAGVHPVGEDELYRAALEGWQTQILDLLDPPSQIPYMGQECPICGQTRAEREVDGERQSTVALWAFLRPRYRAEGSYGLCRACDTVLARDADPLTLRQKMNGTIRAGRMVAFSTESGEATREAGM